MSPWAGRPSTSGRRAASPTWRHLHTTSRSPLAQPRLLASDLHGIEAVPNRAVVDEGEDAPLRRPPDARGDVTQVPQILPQRLLAVPVRARQHTFQLVLAREQLAAMVAGPPPDADVPALHLVPAMCESTELQCGGGLPLERQQVPRELDVHHVGGVRHVTAGRHRHRDKPELGVGVDARGHRARGALFHHLARPRPQQLGRHRPLGAPARHARRGRELPGAAQVRPRNRRLDPVRRISGPGLGHDGEAVPVEAVGEFVAMRH
mmetsp:Transcript_103864/g.290833  ORF Transcript_103864/g.290833 Transcript_103864/m.290833 type:complete len:263 (+) Transcript_103864:62-850(+)